MIDLQGQAAANNGKNTEERVAEIVKAYGGRVVQYKALKDEDYSGDHTLLVKNRPYTNMFGEKNRRGDFFLSSIYLDKPLCIEVRSQKVKGSVSEKMPTLLGNCKSLGVDNVLIVIDGDGHNPNVLRWLVEQASESKKVNIKVMGMLEFADYIGKIFKSGQVC